MITQATDLFQKWVWISSECELNAKSADREDYIRLKTEASTLRHCAEEMAITLGLDEELLIRASESRTVLEQNKKL